MKFFYRVAIVTIFATFALNGVIYADGLSTDDKIEQLTSAVAQLQVELEATKREVAKVEKVDGFYVPQIFGTVLTTFAISGYDGSTRFNVRNTRFGVKGNAARDLSYSMQIDFHNQGSISVLDAFVRYKHNNFDATLGQQHIHLSTELDRGPSSSLVNSRSYASILCTGYYEENELGEYSMSSLGSRDIGLYLNYTFQTKVPITISAGAFNGLGTNDTEWSHRMNYVMRVMAGSTKGGLRGGGSYYLGDNILGQDVDILSAELSYTAENTYLETLYQQRRLQYNGLQIMQLGLVQGYYNIPFAESKFFSYFRPTLRWDWGDDLEYLNVEDSNLEKFNVHRLTPQLNLGFNGEKVRSRIGVSYEKIFMKDTPSDIAQNSLMHDKFTISFTATF